MKKKILAFLFALVMIVPGALFFTACKDDEPKKYVRSLEVAIKNQDILARFDEDKNTLQYTYGEKFEISKEDFIVNATFTDGSKGEYTSYDLDFDSGLKASTVTVREHGYDFRFVVEDEVKYTMHVNVNKAKIVKPTLKAGVTYVYSGEDQSVQFDGFNAEAMIVSGATRKNANASGETYKTTVSLASSNNFEWEDGTNDPLTFEWTIERKPLNKPTILGTGVYPYTGNPIQPEFSGFDPLTMSYESGFYTEVNNHHAVFELIDKANYVWSDGTDGQALVAWSIVAQEVNKPTAQTTSFTYDASQDQSIVLAGFDANKMLIKDGTKRNAGHYTAVVSLRDNFKWADGTTAPIVFEWDIYPKALDFVPSIDDKITENYVGYYTGKSQRVILNYNQGSGEVNVSGDVEAINAGTHVVTFTLNPNYTWPDGTKTPINCEWTIEQASVAKPVELVQYKTYVAGGQEFLPEGFDANTMSIAGNVQENVRAEAYVAVVSLKDTDNYMWVGGGNADLSIEWFIKKAQLAKPALAQTPTKYYYDYGNDVEAIVDGFDAEKMTISNNVQINAGTYFINVSLKNTNNYEWADGSVSAHSFSWTINAITVKKPQVTRTYVYTGSEQTAVIDKDFDANIMTILDGNVQTYASNYGITVALDDNFKWEGATSNGGNCSVPWSILPKEVNLVPNNYVNGVTYNAEKQSIVSYMINFDDDFMNIVGHEYVEAGDYEAVITLNPNYVWEADDEGNRITEVRIPWHIYELGLSYPSINEQYVYNGQEQTLIPSGYYSKYMTISNNVQTNAGTYDVVVGLKSESCYWYYDEEVRTYTLPWTIEESIDLSNLNWNEISFTYSGEAQAPVVNTSSLEFEYTYYQHDAETDTYVEISEKPVNVGRYKVSAQLVTTGVSTTGSVNDCVFDIGKYTISSSDFNLSNTTFYYDGNPITIEYEHKFDDSVLSIAYSYEDSLSSRTDSNVFTAPGDYHLYAKITLVDTDNYELNFSEMSNYVQIIPLLVKSISVMSFGSETPVVYTLEEFFELDYLNLGDTITFDVYNNVSVMIEGQETLSIVIDESFMGYDRDGARYLSLSFRVEYNDGTYSDYDYAYIRIKWFDITINGEIQHIYSENGDEYKYGESIYYVKSTDKTITIDFDDEFLGMIKENGYYFYYKNQLTAFPLNVNIEDLYDERNNRYESSLLIYMAKSANALTNGDYLCYRINLVYPTVIDSITAQIINVRDNSENQVEAERGANRFELSDPADSYLSDYFVLKTLNVNFKPQYAGYTYKITLDGKEVDSFVCLPTDTYVVNIYDEFGVLVETQALRVNLYTSAFDFVFEDDEDYNIYLNHAGSNDEHLLVVTEKTSFAFKPAVFSQIIDNQDVKVLIDDVKTVNYGVCGGYESLVKVVYTYNSKEYVIAEYKMYVHVYNESNRQDTYFEEIHFEFNFEYSSHSGSFYLGSIKKFHNEVVLFFESSMISPTMKTGYEYSSVEPVKHGDLPAFKFVVVETANGAEHTVYIPFITDYPVDSNTNISSAIEWSMTDSNYNRDLTDDMNKEESVITLTDYSSAYGITLILENQGTYVTLYNADKSAVVIDAEDASGEYTLCFSKAGTYILEIMATDGSTRDITFVVSGEFPPLIEAIYGDVTLNFDMDMAAGEPVGNMEFTGTSMVGYLGEVELEEDQETLTLKVRSSMIDKVFFDAEGLTKIIVDTDNNVTLTILKDTEGELFHKPGVKYLVVYVLISFEGEEEIVPVYFLLCDTMYDVTFTVGNNASENPELNLNINLYMFEFEDFEMDWYNRNVYATLEKDSLGLEQDATTVNVSLKYYKEYTDSSVSVVYASDMMSSPVIHFVDNRPLETPVSVSLEIVSGGTNEFLMFYVIVPGLSTTKDAVESGEFILNDETVIPVRIYLV